MASNSTCTEESLNFFASGTGEDERVEDVVLDWMLRSEPHVTVVPPSSDSAWVFGVKSMDIVTLCDALSRNDLKMSS